MDDAPMTDVWRSEAVDDRPPRAPGPSSPGLPPPGLSSPVALAAEGVALIQRAIAEAGRLHGTGEAATVGECAPRMVLDAANAATAAHFAAEWGGKAQEDRHAS